MKSSDNRTIEFAFEEYGWITSFDIPLIRIPDFIKQFKECIASLSPLLWENKYYGSIIKLSDTKKYKNCKISVWNEDETNTPSDRELALWNCTRQQWDDNDIVYPETDPEGEKARNLDITSDNHYENQSDYELCLYIVNSINGEVLLVKHRPFWTYPQKLKCGWPKEDIFKEIVE